METMDVWIDRGGRCWLIYIWLMLSFNYPMINLLLPQDTIQAKYQSRDMDETWPLAILLEAVAHE